MRQPAGLVPPPSTKKNTINLQFSKVFQKNCSSKQVGKVRRKLSRPRTFKEQEERSAGTGLGQSLDCHCYRVLGTLIASLGTVGVGE